MTEYEFELVFKLNTGEDPTQYLDALFEAGCDDSAPAIGQKGYIALTFNREAGDAVTAILSAIKDVKKAIPHAELESAGPYLFNLTELAFEFCVTKQYMQKLARENASFPLPFIGGKTSYWKVDEVALWLVDRGFGRVDQNVIETMKAVRSLNLLLEKQRVLEKQRTSAYPDIEGRLEQVA